MNSSKSSYLKKNILFNILYCSFDMQSFKICTKCNFTTVLPILLSNKSLLIVFEHILACSNGLEVRRLDSKSTGSGLKPTGWLQG